MFQSLTNVFYEVEDSSPSFLGCQSKPDVYVRARATSESVNVGLHEKLLETLSEAREQGLPVPGLDAAGSRAFWFEIQGRVTQTFAKSETRSLNPNADVEPRPGPSSAEDSA